MELNEIIRTERTMRKFEQKEIPHEVYESILENVRLAHCGNNKQLLRYVLVTSREKRDIVGNMVHFAAALPKEIGEPKDNEKAMGYIVITKPAGNTPVQDIDTGIAAEVITATAWQYGVASCMMLNFNVQQMNELLQLPEDRTARMVIALGYPMIRSTVVDLKEDGNTAYYVDEQINYYVPKRKAEDISKEI